MPLELLIFHAYRALVAGETDTAKSLLRAPAGEYLLQAFEAGAITLPEFAEPIVTPAPEQPASPKAAAPAPPKGRPRSLGELKAGDAVPQSDQPREVDLAKLQARLMELTPDLTSINQRAKWLGFKTASYLPAAIRLGQTSGTMTTIWATHLASRLGDEILVSTP